MIEHKTDYKKGIKYADKLIRKAIKERDKKGYRENLGYDSENELKNYLETLNLNYFEECKILDYFERKCDRI